jgi:hypothetical protein
VTGFNSWIPQYWKNGETLVLPQVGKNVGKARAIAVVGSDVYVVGEDNYVYDSEGRSHSTAVYWKNGTVSMLANGERSGATDIAVVESDAFMSGYIQKKTETIGTNGKKTVTYGNGVATYWKNGEAVYLSDGSNDATADAIVVVKK